MKTKLFAAVLTVIALPALAQQPTQFHDTSMLKPPAGAKVAVVEFEDLECPACANAAPIVHKAVEQYRIPLVRYDFPLKMHVWSFDAAVYARWMQDKVNPKIADEYRAIVFANQMAIASKDDLAKATRKFLADRKIMMPFQVDPTGTLANKVRADYALGERLGVQHTPTIVVVTANHYDELTGDASQIYGKIDAALAATKSAAPAKKAVTRKK